MFNQNKSKININFKQQKHEIYDKKTCLHLKIEDSYFILSFK